MKAWARYTGDFRSCDGGVWPSGGGTSPSSATLRNNNNNNGVRMIHNNSNYAVNFAEHPSLQTDHVIHKHISCKCFDNRLGSSYSVTCTSSTLNWFLPLYTIKLRSLKALPDITRNLPRCPRAWLLRLMRTCVNTQKAGYALVVLNTAVGHTIETSVRCHPTVGNS